MVMRIWVEVKAINFWREGKEDELELEIEFEFEL